MKTKILGVNVDVITFDETIKLLLQYLTSNKNHIMVTPNPEMIVAAKNSAEFKHILNSADVVIPDGIGVVFASKLNKAKIKERVAGCDVTYALFNKIKNKDYTVYILGAGKKVAETAKKNMEKEFSGINIVGTHDGFFDEEEEKAIIAEIIEKKPDILLVGLGMVKQESWAYKYKEVLPVKLTCCIGGTIDVMAGNVKRAPQIFIKLNLEWFYRLIKQPKRFLRILKIPLFVALCLKSKFFNIGE